MDRLLKFKKTGKVVGVAVLVIVAFFIGTATRSHPGTTTVPPVAEVHENHPAFWTCSMHPNIKLPQPGKCPICFMDLIPIQSDENKSDTLSDGNGLVLSKRARTLAGIVTVPVIRRGISADISMSGKISFDETRVETIAARVSGRIDRLFANTTGIRVATNDHLAQIYSPELIALQQELISSARAFKNLQASASDLVRTNAASVFSATKERVRLLGFSGEEIDRIINRMTVNDHMTITAGREGIVIGKFVNEGDYVGVGSPLLRIADMRSVWVLLDAYESDLSWLRIGQKVECTVEAFAGEVFKGTISLIDPVVDPLTRTVKVRVVVDNKDLRLKPDMFVKAVVKSRVSQSGRVKNTSLRGKWICPMHPEIIKAGPATCDICGMPLIPAESLGYVTSGFENVDPLIIPATAPLLTGERAVVYVETANDSSGARYEGRVVVLGARVNDYYVVKSGLAEGEKIVVNGAFRIDSELQIRAKPSMMSPPPPAQPVAPVEKPGTAGVPAIADLPVSTVFIEGLTNVLEAYFYTADALTTDDQQKVLTGFDKTGNAVAAVPHEAGKAYEAWNTGGERIVSALEERSKVESMTDARTLFEKISTQMIMLHRHYGKKLGGERYVAFCPMAFDNKGAYWLQQEKEIRNPYFGPKMLHCGELRP